MKKWEPIELLRHARHDWLNHLQLIKGYHALGQAERVNEIIDQIIQLASQESKLSSINMPNLALLLITYNWESPSFILNYEVIGEGKIINVNDQLITHWFETFFSTLNDVTVDYEDNELSVTLQVSQENVSFIIEFYGILKEIERIENFLQEENKACKVENINMNEEAFSFELNPIKLRDKESTTEGERQKCLSIKSRYM